MEQNKNVRICACCGNPLRFQYECNEICPVCGWEDDDIQNDDPDFDGGANDMSLNEAKAAYRAGKPIR